MACGFSVGQRRCRRMPTSTSVAPVARPARTPGTCCLPRPFFSSSPNSGSAPAGSSGAPEVALQSPPLPPGSPPLAVSVTCPPWEPAEQVGPGAVTALHSHRPVDPHATCVPPGALACQSRLGGSGSEMWFAFRLRGLYRLLELPKVHSLCL